MRVAEGLLSPSTASCVQERGSSIWVESKLPADYFMTKSRESQQSKIDELGEGYRVVVEGIEQRK